MICPTVKIQSGDSFIVINESDFSKDKHQLFSEKPVKIDNVSKPKKAKSK